VQRLKERVFQSFRDFNSLDGVQIEHLVEQVECFFGVAGHNLSQVNLLFVLEGLDVLESVLIGDLLLRVFVGRATQVDDEVDLFDVVLTGEHDFSAHDFSKSAACGPHVDLMRVFVTREHNLGSTIVASHDVLGQIFTLLFAQVATEAKVTDFEITVLVQQNVTRLEISMNNIGRVQVLKSAQDLVDEVLDVLDLQLLLRTDNSV